MDVVSRPLCQRCFDLGMFLGGVVIDDEMDVELWRDVHRDMTQEREELMVTMACFALSDDLSGGDVESGKQGGSAMARCNRG